MISKKSWVRFSSAANLGPSTSKSLIPIPRISPSRSGFFVIEPFEKRIQAGYVLEELNIPNLNSLGIEEDTMKLAFTQPCANGCASRFISLPWGYFSLREEIKSASVSSVVFSSPGKINSSPGFKSFWILTLGPCPTS
ncbi:hypothetical protein LBHB_15425 [Leptospira borgpetersenii serovar Hardjo]|nr:hypothetical protein LBHB_15425 [Leptospira borgpetersenii serovar Hardjo]